MFIDAYSLLAERARYPELARNSHFLRTLEPVFRGLIRTLRLFAVCSAVIYLTS